MATKIHRTIEQKQALLDKIDQAKKVNGLTTAEACEQLKLCTSQYYKWPAEISSAQKKTKKTRATVLNLAPLDPVTTRDIPSMTLVMGTPKQLAEFLTYRNQ